MFKYYALFRSPFVFFETVDSAQVYEIDFYVATL